MELRLRDRGLQIERDEVGGEMLGEHHVECDAPPAVAAKPPAQEVAQLCPPREERRHLHGLSHRGHLGPGPRHLHLPLVTHARTVPPMGD